MLRKLVLFAALTALAAASADVQSIVANRSGRLVSSISQLSSMRLRGGADVKEKITGISFKDTISAGGKSLTLVGCGDRKKAIVGPVAVNVYAVGLYVDPSPAKAAAPADAAAAAKALASGSYTKALKIIMARTVGAQKIGDALAEALEPKVKGTDAPIKEFKDFFAGLESLASGNEITFTQTGSTLKVQVPSASKDFTSAALCKAMFDIYLGDTPVSPNGKKAMAEGLLKLCK
jgi:hypothetical protein